MSEMTPASRIVNHEGNQYAIAYSHPRGFGVNQAHCVHWAKTDEEWFPTCGGEFFWNLKGRPLPGSKVSVCRGCFRRLEQMGLLGDVDRG